MENWWSREVGEGALCHRDWEAAVGTVSSPASSSDAPSLDPAVRQFSFLGSPKITWGAFKKYWCLGLMPDQLKQTLCWTLDWWFQGCGWTHFGLCSCSLPLSVSKDHQGLVSLYTDLSPWLRHFQMNLCLNIQILQANALFPLDHSTDLCVWPGGQLRQMLWSIPFQSLEDTFVEPLSHWGLGSYHHHRSRQHWSQVR